MTTRQERRERIVELVARNQIENQEQLQALLLVEGITATQATISRDLRDLGITKGPAGYQAVKLEEVSQIDPKELRRALRSEMQSADRAGSLLVLRTSFGRAKALAVTLEQSRLPHIVGLLAGDDTVLIATRSASQAGELRRLLRSLAR